MSEIEESKQRPEVDETKRQQDEEKIRNEGGPRLNGRLAATAVGLMVGLVILLTLAVQSSGPGAQPAGRNGTDDTASNKSRSSGPHRSRWRSDARHIPGAPDGSPTNGDPERANLGAGGPSPTEQIRGVGAGQVHEGPGGAARWFPHSTVVRRSRSRA